MTATESSERAVRSIRNKLATAKFPNHRDLVGSEFEYSSVAQKLVQHLHMSEFMNIASNVVLVAAQGHVKPI